ncbi:PREDICTED: transcription cofactor vestigial-like protein 2 [Miniopterus natalensis]|uniref:transcription cofactor vestigial-like protein 2 n=1 Tax=Miniopterus natalensis TaxID=291302 RepID=UPI0007A6F5A3|nr:PREDICTED: transcription cofactor vestigial-like protein 2 [Miniopterus natalensis]
MAPPAADESLSQSYRTFQDAPRSRGPPGAGARLGDSSKAARPRSSRRPGVSGANPAGVFHNLHLDTFGALPVARQRFRCWVTGKSGRAVCPLVNPPLFRGHLRDQVRKWSLNLFAISFETDCSVLSLSEQKLAYYSKMQEAQECNASPSDSSGSSSFSSQTPASIKEEEGSPEKERPPEAEYINSRCVLFTYFQGDISSVVDEHFSRALSQPSSYTPSCTSSKAPRGSGPWRGEYQAPLARAKWRAPSAWGPPRGAQGDAAERTLGAREEVRRGIWEWGPFAGPAGDVAPGLGLSVDSARRYSLCGASLLS